MFNYKIQNLITLRQMILLKISILDRYFGTAPIRRKSKKRSRKRLSQTKRTMKIQFRRR